MSSESAEPHLLFYRWGNRGPNTVHVTQEVRSLQRKPMLSPQLVNVKTLVCIQIFLLAGWDPSGTLKNVFWRKHTEQRAFRVERRVNYDIKYLRLFSQHSLNHKSDLVRG